MEYKVRINVKTRLPRTLTKKLRLYVNYFQPSLKLRSKERVGGKVSKCYDQAKTPYRRLIDSSVSDEIKSKMTEEYQSIDPVKLLAEVKKAQEKFWQHAWEKQQKQTKEYNSLLDGVAKDLRAVKQKLQRQKRKEKSKQDKLIDSIDIKTYQSSRKPRKISSRKREWFADMFRDVWTTDVLPELESNTSIAATDIMKKLSIKYPRKFHMGKVRTIQRRIATWRDNQRLRQQKNKGTITSIKTFFKGVVDRKENGIYG